MYVILILLIFKMNKMLAIIGIALLVTCISSQGASPCPIQTSIGSLISARITIAQQLSLVTLVQGVDIQCYNYTLPYAFIRAPDVVVGTYYSDIAVSDFEAQASTDLFFSIKPLQTSTTFAPFLIRTHWKYTYWNKIAFNFIAEDRNDFQSNYYQIDTGALGGCEAGKNIQILLPFKNSGLISGYTNLNYNLFIHGFEISSVRYNSNSLSPFQVQIAASSVNASGIIALITVTTITQVQAVHISYISWVKTDLTVATGNFTYDTTIRVTPDISYSPSVSIGPNYARIFGLTGFIINYNYQNISLATTWTGSKFTFDFSVSQNLVQYYTFQYIFFIGSMCGSCPSYDFMYNGVCTTQCPSGSYPTADKTCITCGDGYYWDGANCMKMCPTGQILNPGNNQCMCPLGTNWTGSVCLNCTLGRIYNGITKMCECPKGTNWNGFSCVTINCDSGRLWNVYSFTCQCPTGTMWNGTYCIMVKQCQGGAMLNTITNQCTCPDGSYLLGGYCQITGCSGGQTWNGSACICDSTYNWNGSVCLLCINGQIWNPLMRACLCSTGYNWNGNFCQKSNVCDGNRVFNSDYQVCICPTGQFWNGATCIVREPCSGNQLWSDTTYQCSCAPGFNWNGTMCVYCINGKVWDSNSKTCVCPTGSQWNNQFCAVVQSCQGGTIWNQNTWSCQCPSTTVWNGVFCLANPCFGGQIWDNSLKTCICANKMVFLNGLCSPPQLACIGGQTWNKQLMSCTCSNTMWFNGSNCVAIQSCVGNQIYNPINNQCTCPPNLVFLVSKGICSDPTCPVGQRWDGQGCVILSCPPGSWYNGADCVSPNPRDNCLPWQLWNGDSCVYYQDTCPPGTTWNGNMCASNTTSCPNGCYMDGSKCTVLPQRCPPPTTWNNGQCYSSVGACPFGTMPSGSNCLPASQCSNGQNWNSNSLQCMCPTGTGWSGKQCVVCPGGQIWDLWEGCVCPPGLFMAGSVCQQPVNSMCTLIPNAFWDDGKKMCLCPPGYSVVGYQCVCNGVQFPQLCDRCAYRANSKYYYGICRCNSGYTLFGTQCLPNNNNGNDIASNCGVSTIFDLQQKRCLPCPEGCLYCQDSYTCMTCSPYFIFDPLSSLCFEICGDGRRYNRECDDGNIISGDGCSADCKIQVGYTCMGGSPNSPDNCMIYNPTSVNFGMMGQIRYNTEVVINIKMNYLPKSLMQSSDCNDRCSNILVPTIVQGEQPISIQSAYVAGSQYTFTINLRFSKPYMNKFSLKVGINPALSKYFQGVAINNPFTCDINPSQLTLAKLDAEDKL